MMLNRASPTACLWKLSASELSAGFRSGQMTPRAALQAVLARIDEINPRLNAIVTLDRNGALSAAEASDRRWAAGQPLSALDGVPLTVKDNILVRGLRATWGSKLFADFVPAVDEEPVARLRAAGAVILGKTNVPEFTLQGYTDNALFGPTRNPWDLALTPGGSSGGAVAAVASGCGPLALCTDGGGSIRRPAAHTGLVGFKPSRDMVPRADGFPEILYNFEVAGPVARTVDDVILAMNVIGGPVWQSAPDGAIKTPARILYAPHFANAPVDPLITQAVAMVADNLKRDGHHVEQDDRFEAAGPIADVWPIISQTGLVWLLSQYPDAERQITPALAAMARSGRGLTASEYLNALDTIKRVDQSFTALFEQFDFVLTPATAAMPWPATDSHPASIAGQAVGPRGHATFTPYANALGLPAISLPCSRHEGTLPVGFQLSAARGRDRMLLRFASDYQKEHGNSFRWPAL